MIPNGSQPSTTNRLFLTVPVITSESDINSTSSGGDLAYTFGVSFTDTDDNTYSWNYNSTASPATYDSWTNQTYIGWEIKTGNPMIGKDIKSVSALLWRCKSCSLDPGTAWDLKWTDSDVGSTPKKTGTGNKTYGEINREDLGYNSTGCLWSITSGTPTSSGTRLPPPPIVLGGL
jgi:hypothetical protein